MSDPLPAIEVDYDLPQPPERVWRTLTEPALLGRWLMENDIKPVVGHTFNFRDRPIPGAWDGIVHCTVLAVEPNKLLRYSWVGGTGDNALDTIVTWTLTAAGTGTRLHLSHTGFTTKNRMGYDGIGKGWRDHLAKRIADVLAAL